MKRIMTIAIMAMALVGCAWAQGPARVPARQDLIYREQPNGDTLRVYLRGDEWSHYTMTEDGWQVIENKKGWLKYAKRNRKGEVVCSWRKAHNAEKRGKCETRWIKRKGVRKD